MGVNANYMPKMYGPVVDKLSYVLKENSLVNREQITSNLEKFKDKGYCYKSDASKHKKLYRMTYVFSDGISGQGTIVVQCDPTMNDQTSYLRVSINPALIHSAEVAEYLNNIIPGGYQRLVEEAWVTRIDVAIDIPNVDINELVVFPGKARKSAQFFNKGELGTQYFGDKQSPLQICLYDKLAQLKKAKKSYPHTELETHYKEVKKLTRIEARIRPRYAGKLMLKDIGTMKNPFENFTVSHYASIKTTDQVLRLALEVLSLSDFKRARYFLTEYQNKQFTKLLKNNMCSWWDHKAIWKNWSKQVIRILNPENVDANT